MTKAEKQFLDNLFTLTTNTALKAAEHQYFIEGIEYLRNKLGPLEEEASPAAEVSDEQQS
jgi:hypothetical protein